MKEFELAKFKAFGLLILSLLFSGASLAATLLINEEEASRPDMVVPSGNLGGVTLSPTATLIEPTLPVKSPFRLVVKFEAFGGAKIVLAKVNVVYAKIQPVVVTHRLKSALTTEGIDLSDASAPPGKHIFRLQLEDSTGKRGIQYFAVTVAKQSQVHLRSAHQ